MTPEVISKAQKMLEEREAALTAANWLASMGEGVSLRIEPTSERPLGTTRRVYVNCPKDLASALFSRASNLTAALRALGVSA